MRRVLIAILVVVLFRIGTASASPVEDARLFELDRGVAPAPGGLRPAVTPGLTVDRDIGSVRVFPFARSAWAVQPFVQAGLAATTVQRASRAGDFDLISDVATHVVGRVGAGARLALSGLTGMNAAGGLGGTGRGAYAELGVEGVLPRYGFAGLNAAEVRAGLGYRF